MPVFTDTYLKCRRCRWIHRVMIAEAGDEVTGLRHCLRCGFSAGFVEADPAAVPDGSTVPCLVVGSLAEIEDT